jgi:LacI family transcriptional regulator
LSGGRFTIATASHRAPVSYMDSDLSDFACQNPGCTAHGEKGLGNLRVDSYYGKSGSLRMLLCKTCGTRFSERKGSQFWGCQLAPEIVGRIYECLDRGCGIRGTARLLGINRNTVDRYKRLRERERRRRRPRKGGPA